MNPMKLNFGYFLVPHPTHIAWTFEAKVGLYGTYVLDAELPILVDNRLAVVSASEPRLMIRMVHGHGRTVAWICNVLPLS